MNEDFFSDRLRSLRNERNISAREMSLSLGQNESYINKIETKQRTVSLSGFFKICDFLNISPTDFFNPQIKNTTFSDAQILKQFKKLTPKQAENIVFLIDELPK